MCEHGHTQNVSSKPKQHQHAFVGAALAQSKTLALFSACEIIQAKELAALSVLLQATYALQEPDEHQERHIQECEPLVDRGV